MGAVPEVKSEVQDELSAALEASRNPGKVVEEPEPEPEVEEKAEEKAEEKKADEKPAAEKSPEKTGEETKPKEEDALFDVHEQNRELRQILRQQKREIAIMQAKLERVEKKSAAAAKKVEEDVDDTLFGSPKEKAAVKEETADEISPVEYVQQELLSIAKVKGPILDTLLETMEINPNYSDVREVCSQSNFDDIFEAVGSAIAEKEGKDASLAALEAEAAVWKMPNPYKYMYGLIKKYHPKYADRQPAKKEETSEKKDSGKKPAEAPSTVVNVPGKSVASNAWTSARIDEMDELELHKVPADIYEKYLAGELA